MEQLEFALKDDGQEVSMWHMNGEYYVQLTGDWYIERHGPDLAAVIAEVVARHAEFVQAESERNSEQE